MDTKEHLTAPRSNPNKGPDDGYSLLARNISRFHTINQLPIKLDLARLDDGNVETLRSNHALYHQTCKLLFNTTKLKRAEKRLRSGGAEDESNNFSNKVPG